MALHEIDNAGPSSKLSKETGELAEDIPVGAVLDFEEEIVSNHVDSSEFYRSLPNTHIL